MMRSLFSGVAGLRTHQTKMDVIGNNIANVNTVAYKSNSVTFQDLLYQTTQNASGANAVTGRAGINAKQIGLGVATGSISTNISTSGAAQNTGSPFDIRISGDSFFVVNDGNNTYYTRAGAFNVDANGTLAMATNGYTVMGYGTTTNATTGETVVNTASLTSLDIMSDENMISEPVATKNAYAAGILDKNSDALGTTAGQTMAVPFYDNLGYSYTAQFKIERAGGPTTADTGQYRMIMTDIVDSSGASILKAPNPTTNEMEELTANDKMTLLNQAGVLKQGGNGAGSNVAYLSFDTFETPTEIKPTGKLLNVTLGTATLTDGNWTYAGAPNKAAVGNVATTTTENGEAMVGLTINLDGLGAAMTVGTGTNARTFSGNTGFRGSMDNNGANALNTAIALNLSEMQNIDNKGSSTVTGKRGRIDSDAGAGCAAGEMSSVSIGMDGKITASYTNGQTKLLGQIATATFANASGLEKAGDNLYSTTLNSGEAVINDITANGGSMTTGELEMSNVDLSAEFTDMITTQRGFQANSRIISVSDSMLEELVNLKR
ncbi:MAG: flagellar hook-basal body complex protein [Lachnospiraceae bacterium]|nr:flagellar hook-basal body complex protein [Lachnospiraceae bacterium]